MIQQILMSFFFSLVISSILAWLAGKQIGKRYEIEKQNALRDLADAMGKPHSITHNSLIELQSVIYGARDLDEVKRYLRKKQEDFVKSLRPCDVVSLATPQRQRSDAEDDE